MAGMYPDNQELNMFGEEVQWPGLNSDGKFTNGSFDDPLVKPSFIPAETLNLILDNLGGMITKLGGTPNNTSAAQLADLFVSTATANKGIVRDAAGRAQVAAPQDEDDIARKVEVDAAVRLTSGFGVCETESDGTEKIVSIKGAELLAGLRICVKFDHANIASEPTLNVNNFGAKLITMDGQSVYTGCFDAGGVYEFVYDGTNWECLSGAIRTQARGENSGYIKYRNGLIIQFLKLLHRAVGYQVLPLGYLGKNYFLYCSGGTGIMDAGLIANPTTPNQFYYDFSYGKANVRAITFVFAIGF